MSIRTKVITTAICDLCGFEERFESYQLFMEGDTGWRGFVDNRKVKHICPICRKTKKDTTKPTEKEEQ